ncbi:MAG: metallophosphoesterase [Planctomycetales bacterium]|nr:metallophosphoesterase [Planctomycetales bacterium]
MRRSTLQPWLVFLGVGFCGPCAAEVVRYAVIADYGTTSSAADDVATLVKSWNPDFVISAGDNNYGDNTLGHEDWDRLIGARYGEYLRRRSDGKYPNQTGDTQRFFSSVGNHDAQWTGPNQSTRAGYLDYFHSDPALPSGRLPSGWHALDRSHYAFRQGPMEIFVFDGHAVVQGGDAATDEAAWLFQSVTSSTATWKFVVDHYPPYSSGYEGNVGAVEWPFAAWGVDALFAGHDHVYDRLVADDTAFFVVGTGGQGLYDLQPTPHPLSQARRDDVHGALLVTVDEQHARYEFVDVDGNVIDVYEQTKAVPEPTSISLCLTVAVCLLWVGRKRRSEIPGLPWRPLAPNARYAVWQSRNWRRGGVCLSSSTRDSRSITRNSRVRRAASTRQLL